MLSIAPLAGGPGYYLALANINYYMEGERGEPMPFWHGLAAQEFGLRRRRRETARRKTLCGIRPARREQAAGQECRDGDQEPRPRFNLLRSQVFIVCLERCRPGT